MAQQRHAADRAQFSIPMRGNENQYARWSTVCWVAFSIPMRGNECSEVIRDRERHEEEFSIPMRGNERQVPRNLHQQFKVFDPHEG